MGIFTGKSVASFVQPLIVRAKQEGLIQKRRSEDLRRIPGPSFVMEFWELPILLFPSLDRILDAGETGGLRSLFALILDQPLRHGPVPAHLAQQIVEQDSLPHRSGEELLGRVPLPAQLPHQRFDLEGELTLRPVLFALLRLGIRRIEQIHPTMWTSDQPGINVSAAVAALGLIIRRGRGNTGWHERILSKKRPFHV